VLPTVFGFSFSELVVVALVALVVMGPKDLPKMLRRLGQWAGKIRRAAADLRAQSGIDDALRSEGLADDIAEIRKLARGELDAVQRAARIEDNYAPPPGPQEPYGRSDDFYVVRDREYPRDGADAYGSLPDNAIVYAETLPRSKHARDPLYVVGDADAELPPEPEPTPDALVDGTSDNGHVAGGVGPTLIGMGAPVPYEPPSSEPPAQEPERVASETTAAEATETSDDEAHPVDEASVEARH
jgi:sec-independent protein translocase protein TatB